MELGPQKTIPILVLGTQFHNGSVCGTLWVSGLTTVATCYHYYCCSNRDYGKDVAGYGTEVKLSVVILSFSMKLLFLWSWSLSLSYIYIYIYITLWYPDLVAIRPSASSSGWDIPVFRAALIFVGGGGGGHLTLICGIL